MTTTKHGSDTRGWKRWNAGDYEKRIDKTWYSIKRLRSGNWEVWTYNKDVAIERLLSDAKRAAHAHAREKV